MVHHGASLLLPCIYAGHINLERGEQAQTSPFYGETASIPLRGNIPPRVFLLRSCSSNPTGRGRRGTPRKHNNNTMALPMGPVPSIAAREFPVNRIRERGEKYTSKSRKHTKCGYFRGRHRIRGEIFDTRREISSKSGEI